MRHEEELLHVDAVVGVLAAVDDVERRDGEDVRVRAADVAVQRQIGAVCGRLGHGKADAEDRVGADTLLVGRAVDLVQRQVDETLVCGVETFDRGTELVDHARDRLRHALAAIAILVAVTQLVRLERSG